jgi:(p)ppGpp synthase/HD superfamily hydrolase
VWGLLHDIVEDGGVLPEELCAAKFIERVVRLVDLCSHDASIEGTDARWVVMIARLVQAGDSDAWAIKVADLVDNLRDSGTMEVGRREWMWNVKRPLMGRVAKGVEERLMDCLNVAFNLESAN